MTYHIYSASCGMWLADDEKTWTSEMCEAAGFTSPELARGIAERERRALVDAELHVMAIIEA